ncbi:MAG: hypothetical protein ACXVGH_11185 [Mycobacteriales bacterium]
MTRDLIEPEGVNSSEEPPASPPAQAPADHGTQAPLPIDVPTPPQPGQQLEEGEG